MHISISVMPPNLFPFDCFCTSTNRIHVNRLVHTFKTLYHICTFYCCSKRLSQTDCYETECGYFSVEHEEDSLLCVGGGLMIKSEKQMT